jgi:hypothetical protein
MTTPVAQLALTKPSKFSSHDTINSWLAVLNLTQGKRELYFNIWPALCHAELLPNTPPSSQIYMASKIQVKMDQPGKFKKYQPVESLEALAQVHRCTSLDAIDM